MRRSRRAFDAMMRGVASVDDYISALRNEATDAEREDASKHDHPGAPLANEPCHRRFSDDV